MLNYLKEELAFLQAGMAAPLSPRAHVFWQYLLYFNNQAAIGLENGDYFWPVWFTVDNGVLKKALGLKDTKRLYDCRSQLLGRDLIRYKARAFCGHRDGLPPQCPKNAGAYALNPLVPGFTEQCLYLPGYPSGVTVWVAEAVTEEDASRNASIYNNYINPLNGLANRIGAPTLPAKPNPFDEVAERGRQAALRRIED